MKRRKEYSKNKEENKNEKNNITTETIYQVEK